MNTSESFGRQQRAILLITSLVSSLVMLDSNVVAVALPTIARSIGADFADVQWVITAYVLPFAALLLAAGSFGDLAGRKRASLIGQVVFALSSLACGLSETPLMLNVSRAVQGVGASLLLTASLAIINHSFQGPARARAYAFWGACLGIAITCGPIIGGVISSLVGWKWAFLINLPICVALVVATLRVVPESRDPEAKKFDYAGVLTFSSGLFFLTWAVIDGNALGWTSAPILGRACGGLLLLAMFVAVEGRHQRPMVDFSLFRSRRFLGSVAAMVGYAGGAQVMIFYLPLLLQNSYGFAPVWAGIGMLPFAGPMFLVPRAVASLGLPSRTVLCLGLGLSAIANVSMALLADGGASYVFFAMAMVLAGTGAGVLNGETSRSIQEAVPGQRSGMASGLGATTRFSALLFGVAGLGAMLISMAGADFARAAVAWGLDLRSATLLIKRFSAGDATSALSALPPSIHDAVSYALHRSFEQGFAAAAWTAAGVSLVAMILTRMLLPDAGKETARADGDALPVVPGE